MRVDDVLVGAFAFLTAMAPLNMLLRNAQLVDHRKDALEDKFQHGRGAHHGLQTECLDIA